MATIKYIVNAGSLNSISTYKSIDEKDKRLIDSFEINNLFQPEKHTVDFAVYSATGVLLNYRPNFVAYRKDARFDKPEGNGISSLELNPALDAAEIGYENGEVLTVYHFLNNLLSEGKLGGEVYIETISPDRTELRLLTTPAFQGNVVTFVEAIKAKLNSNSYFSDFKLNFGEDRLITAINIQTETYKSQTAILVKLYAPLPAEFSERDQLQLVELVADSAVFEIDTTIEFEEPKVPTLKGPNYDIELASDNSNPTEYFNFEELFSFPVENSYYKLRSLFNEKSAQISIDHSDYSTFIHFSSAEERLLNFKYKLDLITAHNTSIAEITNTGYTLTGASSTIKYYEDQIKGIINNFDHYERHLYYENADSSWPKTNTSSPYINDTSSAALTWFNTALAAAQVYDNTNLDVLTNAIPEFIREDEANRPLMLFVHMLAQHYDNLWIYTKAVSDKYDADNRLDFGVSKDLVRQAVESFGVKLYNSNFNLNNLFKMFIGEAYDTSLEPNVTNLITVTDNTSNSHLQPMPFDNYQKEVYKRIYHNLPLLLKSKGTERGLRALINCFGIPSEMLQVRMFGGQDSDLAPFYGPFSETTSSLGKIRTDNTGSEPTGSTLSNLTTINQPDNRYSVDIHTVEVGVSPSNNINDYIRSNVPGGFDIDEYIGDPREAFSTHYDLLDKLAETTLATLDTYDLQDFIRLIKFFDNAIFRIVRDFIPARSNLNSGIIIKPHILDRSKAKQVEMTWSNESELSGSIDMIEVTGSHGSSFGSTDQYSTSWVESVMTISGSKLYEYHNHEEPKYDGEFSGSYIEVTTGELNDWNDTKIAPTTTIEYGIYTIDARASFCDITGSATAYTGGCFTYVAYCTTAVSSTNVDYSANDRRGLPTANTTIYYGDCSITYTDCLDRVQSFNIGDETGTTFCAQPGTIVTGSNVVVYATDVCVETVPTSTPTITPTPTSATPTPTATPTVTPYTYYWRFSPCDGTSADFYIQSNSVIQNGVYSFTGSGMVDVCATFIGAASSAFMANATQVYATPVGPFVNCFTCQFA